MAAKNLPTVVQGVLKDGEQRIVLESEAWFAWLETAQSFRYVSVGVPTLYPLHFHKRNNSGHFYWYAYRTHNAKSYNVYAGKSQRLTAERLDQAVVQVLRKAGVEEGRATIPDERVSQRPP